MMDVCLKASWQESLQSFTIAMQNPLMAFGYIQKYIHTELHVKAFEYSEGVSRGLFCTEETYWYNVLYIITGRK